MTKKFFKTKKVFLLSAVIPTLLSLWTFLSYREFPRDCSGSFDIDVYIKCESFLEYLKSFSGVIQTFIVVASFVISLFAISSLFFFLKGKKTLGNIFLVLFVLSLLFMLLAIFGV